MPPPAAAVSPPTRRQRWIRRLLFALIVAGTLFLCRASLFRGVGSLLVVEDNLPEVEVLVLLNGDRMWLRAAEMYHAGAAKRFLIIWDAPGRLERLGVLTDPVEEMRREMEKHAIPETAVEVVKMEKSGDWNRARQLRIWLNEHPEAQACILCDRFSTRRTSCLFNRELGDAATRVQWCALVDRRYDESNWQQTKVGVLHLFDGYLNWGHVWLYGNALGDRDEWDPDTYQQRLR